MTTKGARELTVWQLRLQDDLDDLYWTPNHELGSAPHTACPVDVRVGSLGLVSASQGLQGVAVDTKEDRVDDAI